MPRLQLEALESREVPATFTVDTPLDVVNPNDNVTSLREAVNGANGQQGGGQHLITFAPNMNGQTISLDSQLTLEKHIYIAGPGSSALTVQRNAALGNSRLFEVKSESDSIIAGLKLRGGKVEGENGGAILVTGGLTLTGCIVRDSTASAGGGIATAARVVGGTTQKSSLTIYDTLITNNSAGAGGGVHVVDGNLTASNGVEISWNTGAYTAGGLTIKKNLYTDAPIVSLTGVTIAYNTAGLSGGGILCYDGELTINGGSISSNITNAPNVVTRGGGIFLGANGILHAVNNPLVGNNTAVQGDGLYIEAGGSKSGTIFYVDDTEYDANPT